MTIVAPASSSRARQVALVTAVVMVVVLPFAFFRAYAFEDGVDWSIHLRFLETPAVVIALLAFLSAVELRVRDDVPVLLGWAGSLLVALSVVLIGGSAYALLLLLPQLDPAIASEASALACVITALVFLVAGGAAYVGGRRLLVRP